MPDEVVGLNKVVRVAEAVQLFAEAEDFVLQVFDSAEHVADGVNAFEVDGEVVEQVAVPFHFPELGGEEVAFAVDGAYFDESAFFQGQQEGQVRMAFLAIFVDDNQVGFHGVVFKGW